MQSRTGKVPVSAYLSSMYIHIPTSPPVRGQGHTFFVAAAYLFCLDLQGCCCMLRALPRPLSASSSSTEYFLTFLPLTLSPLSLRAGTSTTRRSTWCPPCGRGLLLITTHPSRNGTTHRSHPSTTWTTTALTQDSPSSANYVRPSTSTIPKYSFAFSSAADAPAPCLYAAVQLHAPTLSHRRRCRMTGPVAPPFRPFLSSDMPGLAVAAPPSAALSGLVSVLVVCLPNAVPVASTRPSDIQTPTLPTPAGGGGGGTVWRRRRLYRVLRCHSPVAQFPS